MKKLIYILICIFFAGCTKSGKITFCEGVSPEGKGLKCGSKFYSGELSAVISSESSFETDKMKIEVLRHIDGKLRKANDFAVKVDPESNSAVATVPLYIGGTYSVRAKNNGKKVAEGKLEIVE